MKKKFISVAMFSALLISTPVFVGCSDYDDDMKRAKALGIDAFALNIGMAFFMISVMNCAEYFNRRRSLHCASYGLVLLLSTHADIRINN